MKTLVVCLLLATLLLMPASDAPTEAGDKTEICHVNNANDSHVAVYNGDGTCYDLLWGRLISVSDKALAKHWAHGDGSDFWSTVEAFHDPQIGLPNADCFTWPVSPQLYPCDPIS